MQKVLSINLAGSVFQIDEDAYTILHQYVESIRTHFKNTQSGAEIANDIEQRLAEMILGRQKTGNLLVNKIIVEEIIALMGKPSDFDALETEASSNATKTANDTVHIKRKLFRDIDNRMLGGVCAGFGAYFGLERWIFRGVLLALFLLPIFNFSVSENGFLSDFNVSGTFLVITYLVLWIAIPKTKTVADRMEMKGEKVNLSSFEKNFRETFDNLSSAGRKPFVRDIDQKMIGGVSAGIATYLGLQIWVVRAIFLGGLFFFGSGLLLYIILWIAVPKGSPQRIDDAEPVLNTGSSINLEKKSDHIVSNVFSKLIGFIEEVFKIVISFISKISGFVLLIALIIAIIAFSILSFSITSYWHIIFNDFAQYNNLRMATWVIFMVPWLILMFAARYLLGKRTKVNLILISIFLFAWIAAIVFSAYSAYSISKDFAVRTESSYKIALTPTGEVLDIMASGKAYPGNSFYFDQDKGFVLGNFAVLDSSIYSNMVELNVDKAVGQEAELYYQVSAFGKDSVTARQNEKSVIYNLSQSNNDLLLSPFLKIPQKNKWRAQAIKLDLKLPIGYKIRINEEAAEQLDLDHLIQGKFAYQLIGKTLEMKQDGLKCID